MDTTQSNAVYGALGAIGCGLGLNYFPAVVGTTGAAGIAVVVGCCLLMMLDAMSDR